jgi:metal-sulfur cluster biosynthetic enzyme
VGDFIAREAERVIRGMNGVEAARAELVDDPPWSPALMSVEGRRMLGWK